MFFALCNGEVIQVNSHIIGLHSDGCKESKCILVLVVISIPLRDGVKCFRDLFIGGAIDVDIIMGTKDNVVAEPVMYKLSEKIEVVSTHTKEYM